MSMKEIRQDPNKLKHTPGSWVGRLNIVKMPIFPKFIQRVNTLSIKIPGKKFKYRLARCKV